MAIGLANPSNLVSVLPLAIEQTCTKDISISGAVFMWSNRNAKFRAPIEMIFIVHQMIWPFECIETFRIIAVFTSKPTILIISGSLSNFDYQNDLQYCISIYYFGLSELAFW